MKARDVALTLAARLPLYVDDFTANFSVASLVSSGTTATATTSVPHSIQVGEIITVTGASTPISVASFTRVGVVGTIVTASDHDLTKSNKVPESVFVDIDGANEPEFNGSFEVLAVNNRRTITVMMPDAGATTATGDILLLNGSSCYSEYSGRHVVTAVTASTFDYELPAPVYSPASGDIIAHSDARIVPTVTIDRILDQYTEADTPTSTWGFVVLGDVTASKSRQQVSDAVDNIQTQSWRRQQLLQDVTLYVVIPVDNDMAAADARDRCEELFKPICQSILMQRFDTQLTNAESNALQFVSHGMAFYDTAIYMHAYGFQQVADTSIEDTALHDCDVAFRDIDLTIGTSAGNGTIAAQIDLDDQPLG